MKIYGHIRKRDLDGIRNDKDAYKFGGSSYLLWFV